MDILYVFARTHFVDFVFDISEKTRLRLQKKSYNRNYHVTRTAYVRHSLLLLLKKPAKPIFLFRISVRPRYPVFARAPSYRGEAGSMTLFFLYSLKKIAAGEQAPAIG